MNMILRSHSNVYSHSPLRWRSKRHLPQCLTCIVIGNTEMQAIECNLFFYIGSVQTESVLLIDDDVKNRIFRRIELISM